MKILLDTHILIWALTDDDRLSDEARAMITNRNNDVFYSVVNLWETELKHNLHPDKLNIRVEDVRKYSKEAGFFSLALKEEHILAVTSLKKPKDVNHSDPFDRVMLAQANDEDMNFLTHDKVLAKYNESNVMIV